MTDKPYEPLLNRERHSGDAQEHYARQLELVADVVNYGTNLIPSCLASSDRQLGDVIVTSVLLKQVVLMLDALGVLVREACADASILQARALFEASLFLEWMLTDDQEKKALYYYVANVRKERQWVKRGVTDDPEQTQFFRNLGEFSDALKPTRQKLSQFAPDRLREIDEFLAKEPYASINREYETIRGNRPFEPAWYAPLGESSVRGVAKSLGRLHEYEIFYVQSSETMHASRHGPHIKISQNQVKLEPIRHLEGVGTTLRFALSVTFHTYQKVLGRYRPGQLAEMQRRYVNEWREAFMSIPQVTYKKSGSATTI
ncbi:MAG: DUF5677 domain-containing protein [Gammaproteobacteria bacterium]|nr:DUF5677 domain-containing protein [Gammaproteobacteria bacterium]